VRRLSVRARRRRRLNVDDLPRGLVEGLSTPNPWVCPGHTHRCRVKLIVGCRKKNIAWWRWLHCSAGVPHSMDRLLPRSAAATASLPLFCAYHYVLCSIRGLR